MTEEEAHEQEIRDLKELHYIHSGAIGERAKKCLEAHVRHVAAEPKYRDKGITPEQILKYIDGGGRYL